MKCGCGRLMIALTMSVVSGWAIGNADDRMIALGDVEYEGDEPVAIMARFVGSSASPQTLFFVCGATEGAADSTNGWTCVMNCGWVLPNDTERRVEFPSGWGGRYTTGRLMLMRGLADLGLEPYAEASLVAEWDGLNNAGVGQSTALATSWKDLVGSRDMTLSAYGSWAEKGLKCTGNKGPAATCPSSCTDYKTIEIVLSDIGTGSAIYFPFGSGDGASNGRIVATYASNASIEFWSGAQYWLGARQRIQAAATYGTSKQVYTNGVVTSSGAGSDRWTQNNVTMAMGNGSAVQAQYAYPNVIHAIRLYSEALDADTLRLHALADRLRFFGENAADDGTIDAVSAAVTYSRPEIDVEGEPLDVPGVTPGYGRIDAPVVGKDYVFTAPEGWVDVNADGTTQGRCTGWEVRRLSDGTCLDSGVTTSCTVRYAEPVSVVWLWDVRHRLSFAIDNGSLDRETGWFASGEAVTVTATCDGREVLDWGEAPFDAVRGLNTLSFAVAGPCAIMAKTVVGPQEDAPSVCVAVDGNDEVDGLHWHCPKRTVAAALAAVPDGGRVLVKPGLYAMTQGVTINRAVTVEGVEGPDGVEFVLSGANMKAFNLSHASAVLRKVTLRGDALTHGGLFAAYLNPGRMESCVVSNVLSQTAAIVYADGGAVVSNCTLVGNNTSGTWSILEVPNGKATHCRLVGNTMNDENYGTALYLMGGSRAINCLVCCNTNLGANAAGISAGGTTSQQATGSVIDACTVVSNRSCQSTVKGGIYSVGSTYNTVCWGNVCKGDVSMNITGSGPVTYCATYPSHAGEGNVVLSSPIFGADWRLTAGPVVDAGLERDWMAASVDLGGAVRVQGGRPDIGCWESAPVAISCSARAVPSVCRGQQEVAFEASVSGPDLSGLTYDWEILDQDGAVVHDVQGTDAATLRLTLEVGVYGVRLRAHNGSGATSELFEDGRALRVLGDNVYVSNVSTPVPPYATPATAAHDLKTAFEIVSDLNDARVLLCDGDYTWDGEITLPKDVTLGAANGPGRATVRCTSGVTAFLLQEASSVLKDLTIVSDGVFRGQGRPLLTTAGRVENCTFENFYSSKDLVELGGGTVVSNCTFRNMRTAGKNVAVYVTGGALVTHCRFLGCSGADTDQYGQAVYFNESSTGTLRNSLIVNCTNALSSVVRTDRAESRIENCTIISNVVTGASSTYGAATAAGTVVNVICVGNTVQGVVSNFVARGNASVTYSCTDALLPGEGNLAVDPQLRTSGSRAWHLKPGSSAVNVGTRLDWMSETATDLDGRPRVHGKIPDLGCYECEPCGIVIFLM